MALIDFQCTVETCGEVLINFARPAKDWHVIPPCPLCGGVMERLFLPPRVAWTVDPVVVYNAPDGSFKYPGDTD